MARRRLFGCRSAVMVLVLCTSSACKDKDGSKGSELDSLCEQLGKSCGDKDKHIDKLVAECKLSAKKHSDKGCPGDAKALFDCYQKDLCSGSEKVWTFDDFKVLANRHNKCVMERATSRGCVDK